MPTTPGRGSLQCQSLSRSAKENRCVVCGSDVHLARYNLVSGPWLSATRWPAFGERAPCGYSCSEKLSKAELLSELSAHIASAASSMLPCLARTDDTALTITSKLGLDHMMFCCFVFLVRAPTACSEHIWAQKSCKVTTKPPQSTASRSRRVSQRRQLAGDVGQ